MICEKLCFGVLVVCGNELLLSRLAMTVDCLFGSVRYVVSELAISWVFQEVLYDTISVLIIGYEY